MNNTAVDIIDRQDLRIESTFAAVEKTVLLQPSATWPPSIPQMDAGALSCSLSLLFPTTAC